MFPKRRTMPSPYDQRMHSASFFKCAWGPSPAYKKQTRHLRQTGDGTRCSNWGLNRILMTAAHRSWGYKDFQHWGRSGFWRGHQSLPCLVWRAEVCRGGGLQPSRPHRPGNPLPKEYHHKTPKSRLVIELLTQGHNLPWLCGPILYILNPLILVGPPR